MTALEAQDTVTLSFVKQSLIHEEKKLNGEYSSSSNEKPSDSGSSVLYHTERIMSREREAVEGIGTGNHNVMYVGRLDIFNETVPRCKSMTTNQNILRSM